MKDDCDVIAWTAEDMVEVYLGEPDDFLKIRETLSRIGVESKREPNTLYQSCHVLHKQGRYFIVHFKELFMLDGKIANFTIDDRNRRNSIALLLSDWGLLRLSKQILQTELSNLKQIKIIPFGDKKHWDLRTKYTIGNVKKKS